jgi:peroxiredoxin
MPIEPGTPAPDFSLTDTNKQTVTLSSLKGENVVLLFFPFAFTSTCTRELCSVRDDIANYRGLDARVYGISTDAIYSLIKYKEEQQLNFDLLSDFNKEACTAYGSKYEIFNFGTKGVAKRSAFVIDREGIVRYAEVLENASEIPNLEAVKATLGSINK